MTNRSSSASSTSGSKKGRRERRKGDLFVHDYPHVMIPLLIAAVVGGGAVVGIVVDSRRLLFRRPFFNGPGDMEPPAATLEDPMDRLLPGGLRSGGAGGADPCAAALNKSSVILDKRASVVCFSLPLSRSLIS